MKFVRGIIFIGLKLGEILAIIFASILIFKVGYFILGPLPEDAVFTIAFHNFITVIVGMFVIMVFCILGGFLYWIFREIFRANWEWAGNIEKKLKKKEDKK